MSLRAGACPLVRRKRSRRYEKLDDIDGELRSSLLMANDSCAVQGPEDCIRMFGPRVVSHAQRESLNRDRLVAREHCRCVHRGVVSTNNQNIAESAGERKRLQIGP
jgi:hypothetical protein